MGMVLAGHKNAFVQVTEHQCVQPKVGRRLPLQFLALIGYFSHGENTGETSRLLKKPCFEISTLKIIGVFAWFFIEKVVFQQPVRRHYTL